MSVLYEQEHDYDFDFEHIIHQEDKEYREKTSLHNVCRFFLKGNCFKGDACPYQHTRPKNIVCKHWLRGLCKKGDDCEFLHELNAKKMPECYFFARYQECNNPECIFLHITPEEKALPCPFYNRGFCKYGPLCTMKHITRVACPDYMAGFCAKGPLCKFAHPKWDWPREDERRKRQTYININSAPPSYRGYTQQRNQYRHQQMEQGQATQSIPTYAGEGAYFDAPPKGDGWDNQHQHQQYHGW